ncbi:Adenylate cyclase, class 3 [Cribrihabitans marinus]|uniref:Adenylate cyclase, class 3 n=1 Tax=Cribrihabitans marinus TaxID=1227549 RepID=A0A1H7A235_9RHOB|nr:nuclear transport factor 2 family protein [Cribrihabitans marinus]GGH29663.1 hypothetical protein GCM10010973_19270 [Cribrihabitans marinus]SEJ58966.1 Adenylate cyclase, class 3 [Cribrihabitans marinus]
MIRPSPELVAVVRRWNEAVRGKNGAFLTNMLSASEHLRYQGTAEGEAWSGQIFRRGFADHAAEIPDFDWQEHSLEAFECGEVGWAHCLATLSFPSNGSSVLHRFTFVLHLEDGVWKMIQLHVSNPMANLEKIGIEHKALDALVQAARDGFRHDQSAGMASVMFTDVANSSAIAQTLGDAAWTREIRRHLDLAREVIEGQGGRLVKSLGDGTMSTFASADIALSAARALMRANHEAAGAPPLHLRIGLHTGDVIRTEDDFFGTVVNKAARIAATTPADEIRVSDATRILAGDLRGFTFTDPAEVRLRGLDGEHVIFRLEWRE